MVPRPSPNYNDRTAGGITMLVLHYTGMISREHALARLCDPAARVSAHYLIDETGIVYALVAEEHRAWHAGVSFWAGARDVNSRSIGIELVNPGHELGYRPFALLQMRALMELSREILARHAIPAHRVLGHSDVAPGRKSDPGELFDWAGLAAQGIGLWPDVKVPARPATARISSAQGEGQRSEKVLQLQKDLAAFGYDVPQSGIYGTQTRAVVTAFQRHFRPAAVDGAADAQTAAILKQLLQQIAA